MAPVHPHKALRRKQIFKPLQYFTNHQWRTVGEKNPAVVAAAFNANNMGRMQINIATILTKGNGLHDLLF
jgi:hypothetical protein